MHAHLHTLVVLAPITAGALLAAPVAAQLDEPFPGTLRTNQLLDPSEETSSTARFLFTLGDFTTVAGIGDLNNDGYDDVAISSPRFFDASDFFPLNFSGVGRVVVHFGGPGPYPSEVQPGFLDGQAAFLIHRPDSPANSQFGFWVAGAGDVNNDGIDDLAISDGASSCSIVFGRDTDAGDPLPPTFSVNDLDGSNGFVLNVPNNKVSSAGDLNHDGIDDLALAELGFGATRGFILFGRDTTAGETFPASISASDFDGSAGFVIDPAASGIDAVAGAGDVNGDGIDDLIAGSLNLRESATSTFKGGAFVLFGIDQNAGETFPPTIDNTYFDGIHGFTLLGGSFTSSAFIGEAVAGAGDMNNDGIDDVAVGSNDLRSFVVFGKDTSAGSGFDPTTRLDQLDGDTGFQISGAGFALAGVGDVNSDGAADLLVGDPYFPGLLDGAGLLIYGRDTTRGFSFPAELDVTNPSTADGSRVTRLADDLNGREFGFSVSSAGDFNADGVSDMILASRECCQVVVVLGRHTSTPCRVDTDADGFLTPADFNAWITAFHAMSPACDQNNDSLCTPADFSAWITNFNAGC